jgi:hypothetical protein
MNRLMLGNISGRLALSSAPHQNAGLWEEAMRKMPFLAPVCVSSLDDPSGHDIEDLEQALNFLRG